MSETKHVGVAMSADLKEKADTMAKDDGGRSLSSLIRKLLEEAWAKREEEASA